MTDRRRRVTPECFLFTGDGRNVSGDASPSGSVVANMMVENPHARELFASFAQYKYFSVLKIYKYITLQSVFAPGFEFRYIRYLDAVTLELLNC